MLMCGGKKVDDILHYVTSHNVDIVDTYRTGRFNVNAVKPRPAKLRTVQDQRFILNSCQKLKKYPQRIYIDPDEPPEARLKSVLDRLRYRAQREGKSAVVNDAVLFIDVVATYSLTSGYVYLAHDDY